jgi:hypothetical protein
MAHENGSRGYARPLSLTPPPTHMQFAAERARAGVKQRVAKKSLDKALNKRLDAGKTNTRAVNMAELTRLWRSFGELRDGLWPEAEERLYRQLAAVLAGEEGSATRAARRRSR